jgi:hypothetical protein
MRGNRRSVNNPEGDGSAAGSAQGRMTPAEPQTSSQGLQFTGFTPIKPLPSIKEVTAQTQVVAQQVMTQQPATVEMQTPVPPQPESMGTQNPTELQPETVEKQNLASPQPQTSEAATTVESSETETFEECWSKMVDVIFQKKPAFYHQLKDYLPRYENDVIYVDVENDFQKNQLEMSKRAMLEYWRNQFKLNVNEIEFVIHEHEKKKVIYTSEDKVENMLEQNPELKDFLQVLNFRIKD